jgi:phospholipase/carboxylesterase
VLLHGRGADEYDLHPLLDALDPERRLHGYTPRAPLSLPPGGAHWYVVPRVGYPDPETFREGYALLTEWFDALPFAAEQIVLGGFSQGAVMSYALGLGVGRPRTRVLIALSGFIPTVEGWEPELAGRSEVGAFIAHGERDQVIEVRFAREAAARLRAAGIEVDYHESPAAHHVDPRLIPLAGAWARRRLEGTRRGS